MVRLPFSRISGGYSVKVTISFPVCKQACSCPFEKIDPNGECKEGHSDTAASSLLCILMVVPGLNDVQ